MNSAKFFRIVRNHILLITCCLFSLSVLAQHPHMGGFNVYYGDLHNHCGISDGTGTPTEAYNTAKNIAGYDFFSLTDHGEMMNSSEWNSIKNAANSFNEDGRFVAFWGFEWTAAWYGHVNVIGSDDYCSSLPFNTFSFKSLVKWVDARQCIAFFNHPGSYNSFGSEFRHFNTTPSEKFVGMELWNGNEGFNTFYYNNGYDKADGGLSYFDEALTRGWRIGAWGAEDHHGTTWGSGQYSAAVLSHNLTRSALMDAFNARRFYSALDRNIEMSFKINGYEMGSIQHAGSYTGEVRLHDGDNEMFARVELLRNGVVQQTFVINETNPVIPFSVITANGDYFYIRVYQKDGDQAISSPLFFDNSYPINELPLISVTSPADGSMVPQGIVNMQAFAFDNDGTIERVAFYINNVFIGNDTTAPFSIDYNADTAGSYTITALAFDDEYATAWSAPVTFTIPGQTGFAELLAKEHPSVIVQQRDGKYFLLLQGISRTEQAVITDLAGRRVCTLQVKPGEPEEIPNHNLRKGLYLIYIPAHPEIKAYKLFIN